VFSAHITSESRKEGQVDSNCEENGGTEIDSGKETHEDAQHDGGGVTAHGSFIAATKRECEASMEFTQEVSVQSTRDCFISKFFFS